MKHFFAFTLLALLTACATPEQIEAQRIEQEQADMATCKSYGLRPGSENFGMCMLQLDLARQQRYDSFRYGYGGYYTPHSNRVGAGIGLGF
ncbi:MAG: hypothetical protein AB7L92_01880 [Alphaproteobacteria bacterium]